MDRTSVYAYLVFQGNTDFPLETVTQCLCVQPTSTWRVGDKVHPDKPDYPLRRFYTCWKYKSDTLETLDVEDALVPLFKAFHSKTTIINQLKKELNLDVRIRIVLQVYDGYTPGLVIKPEFSAFASTIDTLIDVDMYVYPFVESEE